MLEYGGSLVWWFRCLFADYGSNIILPVVDGLTCFVWTDRELISRSSDSLKKQSVSNGAISENHEVIRAVEYIYYGFFIRAVEYIY